MFTGCKFLLCGGYIQCSNAKIYDSDIDIEGTMNGDKLIAAGINTTIDGCRFRTNSYDINPATLTGCI